MTNTQELLAINFIKEISRTIPLGHCGDGNRLRTLVSEAHEVLEEITAGATNESTIN